MVNPLLHAMLAEERAHDHARLERRLEHIRALEESKSVGHEPVTLRLDTIHDDAALVGLALLAGRRRPETRHVLAEIEGQVVAALPLNGEPAHGDPFFRTAHIVPLLELRARQIAGRRGRGRQRAMLRRLRAWD